MPRSLLTPRRTLLILAVLLLVNSVLPTRYATKVGYVPRSVVTFVTSPFAWPLRAFSETLRAPAADRPDFGGDAGLATQLEQRLLQVRQLESQLQEAQDLIVMLSQSRELLSLAGVRLVPARVTGYSADRVRPTFTIDRGRTRGVHDGAPVVYGINLVGRVSQTYPATSDVELITARETQLQVRILPPRTVDAPRELVEMVTIAPDGSRFEVRVKIDDPVEVGDLAHLIDERWPYEARGFVVGQVRTIARDPTDPLRFKQVLIHPLPPLEALSRITVLAPVE